MGRASGGSTRQLNVYEPDGTVRPGWPAPHDGEPGYGWGMYNENVAVADMNGDGLKEVFGPTDTHYITALDRNGNQLPANPIYTGQPAGPKVWRQVGVHVDHAVDLLGYADCGVEHRPNFANSAPAVADVNGDGVPEMDRGGQRLQLRHEPLHRPLPHAVHLQPGPHALERQRLRLDGDPGARPGQRAALRGLQRHRERRCPTPCRRRPRRGRASGRSSSPPTTARCTPTGWTRPSTGAGPTWCRPRAPPATSSASRASRWWPTSTTTARPRCSSRRGPRRRAAGPRRPAPRPRARRAWSCSGWPCLRPSATTGTAAWARPRSPTSTPTPTWSSSAGTHASGVVAYDLPGHRERARPVGDGPRRLSPHGRASSSLLSIDDVAVTEGNAGTTNAFTVRSRPPTDQTVTVGYATADGTAGAGSDYTSASGTHLPRRHDDAAVTVRSRAILLDEANETFFVNLSGRVGGRGDGCRAWARSPTTTRRRRSRSDDSRRGGQSGSTLAELHSLARPPRAARLVTPTRPPRHGHRRDRLHGGAGTVVFPPGSTEPAVWRWRDRRPHVRGRRDVHRQPGQPGERNPRRRAGPGDDRGTTTRRASPSPTSRSRSPPRGRASPRFTVTLLPPSGGTVTVEYSTAGVHARSRRRLRGGLGHAHLRPRRLDASRRRDPPRGRARRERSRRSR